MCDCPYHAPIDRFLSIIQGQQKVLMQVEKRKEIPPIMLGQFLGCTLPNFYIVNLVLFEVSIGPALGQGGGGYGVVYAQW